MSFDTCKDVWVFIESFQGQPKSVGLELLGQGRKLADGLKQKLCAIVIGKDVDAAVKESAAYGADKIYVIQGDEYENYSADAYGNVFLKLCEKYDPNTILVGATVNGRDLGSKIAVSLRTGLTADCTALSVDEDTGNVVWERPAFGGNLYAQILCSETADGYLPSGRVQEAGAQREQSAGDHQRGYSYPGERDPHQSA